MRRRAALALPALLPVLAASCAAPPAVVEVIEAGALPSPLTPALIVPSVSLPEALADHARVTEDAEAGLRAAIGDRPSAPPGPDAALAAAARARGLPRVALLSAVQAARFRGVPAAGRIGTEVAIRVRVLDARSAATLGQATFTRRASQPAGARAAGAIAAEIEALARDLLR